MRSSRGLSLGLLGAMFFAVVSCVETSSGDASGGNDQANGGIGGSGSGTVSGYGSVIINGTREYAVEAQTLLFIDDEPVQQGLNDGGRALPLGATVEFLLGNDIDENLISGTATEIRAFHQVVGPITSTDPLEVLNQPVQLSSGTVDETGGTASLSSLTSGDVVQVAGNIDQYGVLHASRFAQPASPLTEWRVLGRVASFDGIERSFFIGGQKILMESAVPDCGEPLNVGQKVLVVALQDAAFTAASTLQQVQEIRCLPDGVAILEGREVSGNLPMTYAGVITSPLSPLDTLGSALGLPQVFEIDGQQVIVTSDTEILDATLEPIVEGDLSMLLADSRVDVDGIRLPDGAIEAKHILVLPDLVALVNNLVCDLLWLLPGCDTSAAFIASPLDSSEVVQLRERRDHEISLVALSPRKTDHIAIDEVSSGRLTTRILAALPDDDVAQTELPRDSVFDPRQLALLY